MSNSHKLYITLFLVFIALLVGGISNATVLTVTNGNNAGAGSLRQAVIDASPKDSIVFGDTMTIVLSAQIPINKPLYIIGEGVKHITIDGNGSTRLFTTQSYIGDTTYFEGIHFTDAIASAFIVTAPVSFYKCWIDSCSTTGNGGAFACNGFEGDLLLHSSTISSCTATGDGGAIHLSGGADLTVVNSTISGNVSSGNGGGIYSTDNGNTVINFYSSTIANNTADNGGGVYLAGTFSSSVKDTMYSSIFADNFVTSSNFHDYRNNNSNVNIRGDNNIIEDGPFNIIFGSGNQVGNDPSMGVLEDNGRCTPTHALMGGSIAIDKGNNYYNLTKDQRGAPRELDGDKSTSFIPDIGAFEFTPYCVINTLVNGAGSLDANIQDANLYAGKDYICFKIPGKGPHKIEVDVNFTTVADSVIIDGYSQPESFTAFGKYPADIMVEVNGSSSSGDGIVFDPNTTSNSELRGLSITQFNKTGVHIQSASNIKIDGNNIGIEPDGIAVSPNAVGIKISATNTANFNKIGGSENFERNIIAANTECGVEINSGANNSIEGNYIGVVGSGLTLTTNNNGSAIGVKIHSGASGNQVGSLLTKGNIISGFALGSAIHISGTSTMANKVENNIIGLGEDGTSPIANRIGIEVVGGAGNVLINENVIARNSNSGIKISDSQTTTIDITNNFIGVDVNQILAGNGKGIEVSNSATNINIGISGEGNVISGNSDEGIKITNGGKGIKIVNNQIGTNSTGLLAVPNAKDGILIDNPTPPVTIGGSFSSTITNVISANQGHGINAQNNFNIIKGNIIGLNQNGDSLGNKLSGISLSGDSSQVGGSINEKNVISSNGNSGIEIKAGSYNEIYSNFIGIDFLGSVARGNGLHGVLMASAATHNFLLGNSTDLCVVSGNKMSGIKITNAGTDLNRVTGVYIGTDLNGANAIPNSIGVEISDKATHNLIQSFLSAPTIISGNDSIGVAISSADSNTVRGCFIGVDTSSNQLSNGTGVHIDQGADGNTIGGALLGLEQNTISGNLNNGVEITGLGTNNNIVIGNAIGTNTTGTIGVPNASGVVIKNGAQRNAVGSAAAFKRNIISGNLSTGISISGSGTVENAIYNNFIGTDITSQNPLSNKIGVYVEAADSNHIGGPGVLGNVVSGNDSSGVIIINAATKNEVFGNKIGVDSLGITVVANNWVGVSVIDAPFNFIGDSSSAGKGNIVSGNTISGILIAGAASSSNMVFGNYVGTDASGTLSLPNIDVGVGLVNGANNNLIGSESGATGNVISGNSKVGVYLSDASQNIFKGNIIGPASDGTSYVGIQQNGIQIDSNCVGNYIGGSITANKYNIISGNDTLGIAITGQGSDSNIVAGNYIGIDKTGSTSLPNSLGVGIADGAKNNTIGSVVDDSTNYISGNTTVAVGIFNAGTEFNKVIGNYIGTGKNTTEALGSQFGVYIFQGAQNNRIGGEALNEGNHITDHLYGVIIEDAGTDHDSIIGNQIGVDTAGTVSQANEIGIAISNGAQKSMIYQNHISGNDTVGIVIDGSGTELNTVFSNIIGPDRTISYAIDSQKVGIGILNGAANNFIGGTNFPMDANTISGNHLSGVAIGGNGTNNNKVFGNYIGCDTLVGISIPNYIGILIADSAQLNKIGGDVTSYPNYISGNDSVGVLIGDTATNLNTVAGNYIGTKTNGFNALPNGIGVQIDVRATLNFIGDTLTSFGGNIISGNTNFGVSIGGNSNLVSGNYIGVDSTGNNGLANEEGGIHLYAGTLNTIGGSFTNKGNIISGNAGNGIEVTGGIFNTIRKNLIGTKKDTSAVLSNSLNGIALLGSAATVIGGANYQFGNIIAGNDSNGIFIGTTGGGHYVNANYIGTDTSGTKDLGNAKSGVFIDGSNIFGNVIGDSLIIRPQNTIAFNNQNGITIASSTRNGLYRNILYKNSNLGIDLSDDGLDANDSFDTDIGGNNKQNHPVVMYAVKTNNGIGVQGFLNSEPTKTYWLEFFGNYTTNTDDEAREYLGVLEVTTNSGGNASFSQFLNVTTAIDVGDSVRATASTSQNTSELGMQVVVTTTPIPPIAPNDTAYCEKDTANMAYLVPTGILDSAKVRWYANAVDTANFIGNDSVLPSTTVGKITYYVTQTVGQVESLPDSVCVTIYPDLDSSSVDSVGHVLCFGDSLGTVSLSGYGGTPPYTFINITDSDTGSSFSSFTFDSLKAGTYQFEVTDSLACGADTLLVIITEPTPLVIQLDSIDVLCHGDNTGQATAIVTGGTSPYSYNWSNSSTGSIINGLAAGSYTVTVTDNNGCTIIDSIMVNEPPPLNIEFIDTTNVLCAGDSTGAFSFIIEGGTPIYNINITQKPSSISNNSGDTVTVLNLLAGTYYITITDQHDCAITDSITITEPDSINISFGALSPTCSNSCVGKATAAASGGMSPYSYIWSSSEVTFNATELCSGYNYVTITDANDCEHIDSVFIDTFSTPSINITPDTIRVCEGECANIQLEFTGNSGPYYLVYEWDSASVIITDTTETVFSDTILELCPPSTTYLKALFVHDIATGCTSDTIGQTIQLIVEPKPLSPFTFGDTLICSGDTAEFWKAVVNSNDSTLWLDEGLIFITNKDTLIIPDLEEGVYTYYTVTISKSDLLCVSDTNQHTVTVISPDAEASESVTVCSGLSIQLSAVGGVSYQWEPKETLNNDTTSNPIASPLTTTLYYVTITTTERCRIVDSILVTVDDSEDCGFHIYNAFSPNGDGDNDVWIIDGIERFPINKVMIFNRWGDKVNEFDNYNNTTIVWDGTGNSGSNLPDGTYFYIVEIPEIQKKLSSWVQLTR